MPQSAGRAGRPPADLAAALAKTAFPLGWGLASFYAFLALYWAVALRPAHAPLGALWAASAVALAAMAAASRRADPERAARLVAAMALLATADSGALLVQTGQPGLMTALFITVLGFGLILLSRWTLLACVAAAAAGWAWAAARWPDPAWSSGGIALLACAVLAFVLQGMRLRLHRQVEEAKRREIEAALRAGEEERRRLEAEAKATFIRLAAHELNTPLTTLTLQSRTLNQPILADEQRRRAAQVLERNVQRLNRTVRDLLLLTQSANGTLRIRAAAVPAQVFLRRAAEAAQAAADAKRIQLAVEAAPGLEVQADEEKLAGAVRKLLDNAIRHTPEGGRVTLRAAGRPGHAALEVSDTGPGVPGPMVERLFQPFHVPDLMRHTGGAGLGLAVAQAVAQAHGGRVTYRRNEEGGATFAVELPSPPAAPA